MRGGVRGFGPVLTTRTRPGAMPIMMPRVIDRGPSRVGVVCGADLPGATGNVALTCGVVIGVPSSHQRR